MICSKLCGCPEAPALSGDWRPSTAIWVLGHSLPGSPETLGQKLSVLPPAKYGISHVQKRTPRNCEIHFVGPFPSGCRTTRSHEDGRSCGPRFVLSIRTPFPYLTNRTFPARPCRKLDPIRHACKVLYRQAIPCVCNVLCSLRTDQERSAACFPRSASVSGGHRICQANHLQGSLLFSSFAKRMSPSPSPYALTNKLQS